MIPVALLTAVGVQVLCQLFKVVAYSVRDGAFNFRYFVSAGGMPSAHAAFVTALVVAVGMRAGIQSEVFAVAFVFGTIVTYDAFRLRGEVERHAKRLNALARREGAESAEHRERLNEMIGHSLAEIVVGIFVGGGLSLLFSLLL
jgi:hypothetical protein